MYPGHLFKRINSFLSFLNFSTFKTIGAFAHTKRMNFQSLYFPLGCFLRMAQSFLSFHFKPFLFLSSVQSLSHVWLFVTPWIAALQASLSITNSQSWPKLMPIELVMPSSHLILCRPLLLLLCPWDSPGKNSGVSSLSLRQGIFPTQRSKPSSPELQADSWPSQPPGKPYCTSQRTISNILW